MISFALILMTLPSRVAAVRARHGESATGRADRAGLALGNSEIPSRAGGRSLVCSSGDNPCIQGDRRKNTGEER